MTQGLCALREEIVLESGETIDWIKHSCAFIEKSSGSMHTSVAIRNKNATWQFGVTTLGAPDAVAASPPHPPDCSVPQARAAELARCCITIDDLRPMRGVAPLQ
jgi:hypothetical protein